MIVGYQGWFACVGDGSPDNNWSHWSTNSAIPGAGNITIKAWPDVRDYTATYPTAVCFLDHSRQQSKGPGGWHRGQVMNAAQTTGRKFYVMYDCSATDSVNGQPLLLDLTFFDGQGRLLLAVQQTDVATVDVSRLPVGILYLRIHCDGSYKVDKTVKILKIR